MTTEQELEVTRMHATREMGLSLFDTFTEILLPYFRNRNMIEDFFKTFKIIFKPYSMNAEMMQNLDDCCYNVVFSKTTDEMIEILADCRLGLSANFDAEISFRENTLTKFEDM